MMECQWGRVKRQTSEDVMTNVMINLANRPLKSNTVSKQPIVLNEVKCPGLRELSKKDST